MNPSQNGQHMTDTTILLPCINGCIRKGTEDTDHPDRLVAKRGMFCLRCFGKAEHALRAVPDLVEHIVSNFTGTITPAASDVRVSGSTAQNPVPFNEQAWVDADGIYSTLATYSAHWAKAMDISPPAPARRSWRDEHGYVIGMPADTKPELARHTAGVLSDWMLIHLPQIFNYDQESVNDLITALSTITAAAGRWPMAERPRVSPMPHVQRDGCDGEIKFWPTGVPGSDAHAICTKCGYQFDLEEFEEAVHDYLLQQQQVKREQQAAAARSTRDRNRSAVVTNHLVGKYGHMVGRAS